MFSTSKGGMKLTPILKRRVGQPANAVPFVVRTSLQKEGPETRGLPAHGRGLRTWTMV